VLLEAQLIAERMRSSADTAEGAPVGRGRLVQLYRRGDIGETAAAELRAALGSQTVEAGDRIIEPGADPSRLRESLADLGPGDVLVLWLRSDDIRSLPPQPPAAAVLFVSGIMGGLEHAPLPPMWRALAHMTYPFALPNRRQVSMDYPLGWMRFKQIPVVDERTQTDTVVACLVTAEAVRIMGEDLLRDHLLETLEMHLGTRLVNGYYPRLTLGPGQRVASKGGFLVRFAEPEGTRLIPDGDWSVP
jgi:hypothetical protein